MKKIIKLKRKNSTSAKWLVLFTACIALFSPNYTQFQLSPLASQLMKEMNLSASQFSSLFTAPMIPSIFLSIFIGILVDRFGIKRIGAIALIISAIGTIGRIYADSYFTMICCMLVTGISAGVISSNGPKIFGSWFGPEKINVAMGIFFAFSTLGMTLGTGTTALLPSMEFAFVIAAFLSVAVIILWILFIHEKKEFQLMLK